MIIVTESLPRSVLVDLGYRVVQMTSCHYYLSLGDVRFKVGFVSEGEAWNAARTDLQQRLRNPVVSGPDYRDEAQKLGFEVTVSRDAPKHGWRNRDLDVCSLRLDYQTEADAWRAAYMWSKRFAVLWKE